MDSSYTCDIAILGGGLSGCLIALALAERRPDLRIRLIEPGEVLGGNHIWSFFDTDIAPDHRWLVEPLICYRWPAYDVAFPAHSRTIGCGYNSIESERLDRVCRERLAQDTIVCAAVASFEPVRPGGKERHLWHHRITLDTGQIITASHAIDARGPGNLSTLDLGWQKFVGLSVSVPGGHGLVRPLIMDATVPQIDGYRFVYCLPFDAETVFIEDTYYSDTPDLDVDTVRERILAYAAAHGWRTNGGGRAETGVLPVVISGDFDAYWQSTGADVAKAGLRSGLFHATTGYSLPDAVRLAIATPEEVDRVGTSFAAGSFRSARARWARGGFYRMLDKMLFRAAVPEERYRVLERFYTLPEGLIGRFYAGQSTWGDKMRILSGKPPVPILRALAAIIGRKK